MSPRGKGKGSPGPGPRRRGGRAEQAGVHVFLPTARNLAKTGKRSNRADEKGGEKKRELAPMNLRVLDKFRYVIILVSKTMQLHAMQCDV